MSLYDSKISGLACETIANDKLNAATLYVPPSPPSKIILTYGIILLTFSNISEFWITNEMRYGNSADYQIRQNAFTDSVNSFSLLKKGVRTILVKCTFISVMRVRVTVCEAGSLCRADRAWVQIGRLCRAGEVGDTSRHGLQEEESYETVVLPKNATAATVIWAALAVGVIRLKFWRLRDIQRRRDKAIVWIAP